MDDLPAEILYNIFDFLFTEDVIKFSILSKRLNNVAKTYSNTNNFLFYIHSINDIELLMKKIKLINEYWPYLLISLDIDNAVKNSFLDKINFNNIRELAFRSTGKADISLFKNIPILDLSGNKWINSLEPLSGNNIKILYLDNINFEGVDLKPIANIKYLSFCYSNIKDLSGLENSTDSTICLRSCHYLTDLTPIKNIKSICLDGCSGITDISPLKNISDIYLTDMYNLKDISPLKDSNNLCIKCCYNIENNLSILKNVKNLTFIGMR